MKMLWARFKTALQSFRSEEGGSIAVETVLVFPILTWAYLATFVYFDAFRVQSTTLKANYTVSDALSRETGYITPEYLDSLYNLHEFLTSSRHDTRVRISIITYTSSTNKYTVRWSKVRGGGAEMTNADINGIKDRLPVMPNGEIVIVVENKLIYEPAFTIGLSAFNFENLVVTRPRFAPQLCYNTLNDNGTSATATC